MSEDDEDMSAVLALGSSDRGGNHVVADDMTGGTWAVPHGASGRVSGVHWETNLR
uniref:Uncharacterized protein n=1 Tax=Peronospora matthiolae TaxID=2874970 RepID=A0AAV1TCH9_9STRA